MYLQELLIHQEQKINGHFVRKGDWLKVATARLLKCQLQEQRGKKLGDLNCQKFILCKWSNFPTQAISWLHSIVCFCYTETHMHAHTHTRRNHVLK